MQDIEDFLTGRLSAEEQTVFRQKMQADPALAVEVDLYREIIQGVQVQGRTELKQRLQQLESHLQQQKSSPIAGWTSFPSHSWQWLGGIAAALILSLTT